MSCTNPTIEKKERVETVQDVTGIVQQSDWRTILLWASFVIAVLSYLKS